jgi:hypothetical protein
MQNNSSDLVNIDIHFIVQSINKLHSSALALEKRHLHGDFDWTEFHNSLNLISIKIHQYRRKCYKLIACIQELESVLDILTRLPSPPPNIKKN